MKIEVTRADIPGLAIWTCWLAVLIALISLVTGSYAEYEPISGFRYGIVAAGWALTAPVLRMWMKKRFK